MVYVLVVFVFVLLLLLVVVVVIVLVVVVCCITTGSTSSSWHGMPRVWSLTHSLAHHTQSLFIKSLLITNTHYRYYK